MANLATVVSRVCEDYLVRPESEVGSTVAREVQLAIDHYATHRMGFNELRVSFTLSNTNGYTLEFIAENFGLDRILAVDSVLVQGTAGASDIYTLAPVTWDRMKVMQRDTLRNGEPSFFCVYSDRLWIEQHPNTDARNAWLEGLVTFPPVEEVTNAWLVEGLELILARTASQVARKRLQDTEMYQNYAQMEAEALAALRDRQTEKLTTGRLSPHL